MTRRAAFTLVEMLIVMAIISMLAGMLLPSLATAREKGRRISCVNNLKQIGYALQMYCDDYGGYIPNNSPLGVPGDAWTRQSTNRLRQLPAMEMGIGKLVATHQLADESEVFGCPSHIPHLPKAVKDDWRQTGPVDGAYLYRELDASPNPDALKRLAGRVKSAYAVVMDNTATEGSPQGSAHKWEWTNILFSDLHAAGALNTPGCLRVTSGAAPNTTTEIITRFTHDGTPEALTQLWRNADAQADK